MCGISSKVLLYKHVVKHGVEKSLFSSFDVTQSADTRGDFGLD